MRETRATGLISVQRIALILLAFLGRCSSVRPVLGHLPLELLLIDTRVMQNNLALELPLLVGDRVLGIALDLVPIYAATISRHSRKMMLSNRYSQEARASVKRLPNLDIRRLRQDLADPAEQGEPTFRRWVEEDLRW